MTDDEGGEFSAIRGALGSIGMSAVIVFGGSILNQSMGYGIRIVITRFLSVDSYGEVILGVTVLQLLGVVSIVGLGGAMTRFLPQAEGKKERSDVIGAIYHIGIGLSVIWSAVGFIAAEFLATAVFNSPGMVNVVRVFSLSLPFYVFYRLSIKGIQGHKETIPNIITSNLVQPLARIGGVAAFALAGFGALGLSVGYNFGFLVGGVVGAVFLFRSGKYSVRSILAPTTRERYGELLSFSVPLAVSASFGAITRNGDRFLLGVFATRAAVGIYDVAFLISQFIMFFGPVLNYLFQPIISEYDANDNSAKMSKLYVIITRWLVILTFPIFALLVLFPEQVITTFFGEKYVAGGGVLSVLAVGFFIERFVGLNGSFLTALGESKLLMYASATTAVLNLILNLYLIPNYGIIGAAVATITSTLLNNGIMSIYIYRTTGITPFTRELLLPTSFAVGSIVVVKITTQGHSLDFLSGVGIAIALGLFFVICILLTQSVYPVELKLADSVFEKAGISLRLQDRLQIVTNE